MNDQPEECRTFLVASYHTDYLFEELSDHYYTKPPGEREPHGTYISVVFDGSQYYGLDDDEETIQATKTLVNALLRNRPEDRQRILKFVHEDDLSSIAYYHVHGTDSSIRAFLRKASDVLIERVPWLECEDDHCDFYHSTIETLVQIALSVDAVDELRPLYEALRDRKACTYCGANDVNECYLPEVIGGYLI